MRRRVMSDPDIVIHPAAVVQSGARLASGVDIGPYCVIGPDVELGRNVKLEAHVSICGHTRIGDDCRFAPFTSIGTAPQDVGYKGEPTRVEIGAGNVFKEFITVHRATVKGGGVTRIGDRNYFMAYSHIAHDCLIGNETIFTNAATLGGHVEVGDYAVMGAFSGVHQFCRIGRYAFIGGFTVLTQDIPPFIRVAGMRPTHIYGLNTVGLRRRGFSKERVGALSDMIKILFFSDLNTTQAADRIAKDFPPGEDRDELLTFLGSSKRGIIKKTGGRWDPESE
jgi:UDP-N-acetylglucosamine acyltransferase